MAASCVTLCLKEAGGGGLTAPCRAVAGDRARRRGAGGFMAVARAVANLRSRTITDGDNLKPSRYTLDLIYCILKETFITVFI